MSRTERLEVVQRKLKQVADFLSAYLPFANSHITYFFSGDLWKTHLPGTIAEAVLSLTDNELGRLPLGDICEHKRAVPLQSPAEVTNACPGGGWPHHSLEQFLSAAVSNSLPDLEVLTDIDELYTSLGDGDNTERLVIKNFMSQKKSHEVDIMADLCASLARKKNISKVIDIGSGRGYLGCQLSLMHGLQVLGADSSSGNTHSARQRAQQLGHQWDGLVRNATGGAPGKQKKPGKGNCEPGGSQRNQQDARIARSKESCCDTLCQQFAQDLDLNSLVSTASDSASPVAESAVAEDSKARTNSSEITDPCNISATSGAVCEETDQTQMSLSKNEGKKGEFISTTQFIEEDTDMLEMLRSHYPDTQQGEPLLLTGLHTCGVLGPSTLQLFVAHECVHIVCNVGCCYHLLQDEFSMTAKDEPAEKGFPLSNCLREQGFSIGRNARMLACQAPHRLAQEAQLPGQSLFWRALLQVVLSEVTGEDGLTNQWQVGKIAAKCTTFQQYVRKALDKLKLSHLKLTDEQIDRYLQQYSQHQRRLQAYMQLRMVLAQCIETLIVLDRLAFLLEQPSVAEAHLCQLFNPVTSPRCYALVAVKS